MVLKTSEKKWLWKTWIWKPRFWVSIWWKRLRKQTYIQTNKRYLMTTKKDEENTDEKGSGAGMMAQPSLVTWMALVFWNPKACPGDTLHQTRPCLLIFFKQFHPLETKYSNLMSLWGHLIQITITYTHTHCDTCVNAHSKCFLNE